MIAPPRRVGHLRLRAPDGGALRRGRFLVEDALRCASIPEATAGRLLVIRHLALGPIDPRATPASVALRVERRVRQLAGAAVPHDAPGAERADAVAFPDRIAAFEALAVHVARGRAPSQWYWRAALPEPRPAAAPALLRALLARALDEPAGPVAVARVIEAARAAGVLDPLLAAIDAVDGPPLLRAFALPPAPIRPAPWRPPTDGPRPGPAWQAPLRRWSARWGPADARLRWLVAAALLAERPELCHTAALAALVEQITDALAIAARRPPEAPPTSAPPADRPRPVVDGAPDPLPGPDGPPTPPSEADARDVANTASPPPSPTHARLDGLPENRVLTATQLISPDHEEPRTPAPGAEPSTPPRPRATAFAGLYFVLPVLARLGLPGAVAAAPEWAVRQIPARILGHIASHLGAAPDDPIRLPIAPVEPPPPLPFEAPAAWAALLADGPRRQAPRAGDPSAVVELDAGGLICALRRPAVPPSGPPAGGASDIETLCIAWRQAVERRLEAIDPALTLAALVVRPGAVLHSRTGVDVIFDLADADLAVRRPGLDIDPGWLPWLGRVVHFHYLVGGRRAGD